jgi:hypothetical protein
MDALRLRVVGTALKHPHELLNRHRHTERHCDVRVPRASHHAWMMRTPMVDRVYGRLDEATF